MTATTFGRLERGRHTRTEKLQAVADAFEVPLEHVLQTPGTEAHSSDVEQLLQRKIREAIREEVAALRAVVLEAAAVPLVSPAARERAALARGKQAGYDYANATVEAVARKPHRKPNRKVNG